MKTTIYQQAKMELKEIAKNAKIQFQEDKPAQRMIINDNFVNNISFGLKNYFGDMLYISNIEEIKEFIEKPHNRNKKLYELVNHLINIEPIKIL